MREKDIDEYVEVFKALANKTRLKMLMGVFKDECNVSRIVKKLNVPQSTISQHLSYLKGKGIVKGRREGTKVCYKVVDKKAREIIELLLKN